LGLVTVLISGTLSVKLTWTWQKVTNARLLDWSALRAVAGIITVPKIQ